MGVARKAEDVDTHAYWADVTDALTEVCKLSPDDAKAAVSKSRQALTGLSDWGSAARLPRQCAASSGGSLATRAGSKGGD